MSTRPAFADMEADLITLLGQGRHDAALEVARRAAAEFPHRTSHTAYWVACIRGVAGDPDEALRALVEATETTDVWWGNELLLEDPDLASVRAAPGFDALLAECERRGARARAAARVEWRALGAPVDEGRAVVVGLHGRTGTIADLADRWGPAALPGVTTLIVQSSQMVGEGMHCWDDLRVASEDLETVAREVLEAHRPVVLAGFSQGGGIATHIALAGEPIAARGVVAIAPSFSRHQMAPADIAELLPGAARRGVRAWLSIGERDERFRGPAQEVAAALEAAGVAVDARVFAGLGHDYPRPFEERLSEALAFVLAPAGSITP